MSTVTAAFIAVVLSLLVSLLLTPIARKFAMRYGVVAKPGGRRTHKRPTPLLGGAAMYMAFAVTLIVALALDKRLFFDRTAGGVLVSASFVAIVGMLDDRFELPGWVQALTIVIAGCILYMFGVTVNSITYPFRGGGQTIPLGYLGIPFTVIWILMVTKAVDCMDGVDGLAAGISLIISATLLLMALAATPKSPEMLNSVKLAAIMSASLVGACLGFLRFNYPPARIFMGTVGAQFLGFMLAAISLVGAFKITTLVAIGAPIIALGVPLGDTALVVIRRLASGKKISEADRTHLHHRLMDKGYSTQQVVWTVYGLTALLCALAYLLFVTVK